jgi:hypothetical protein
MRKRKVDYLEQELTQEANLSSLKCCKETKGHARSRNSPHFESATAQDRKMACSKRKNRKIRPRLKK